jgi:exo-beta-1,3-glucanase (GH17 family)
MDYTPLNTQYPDCLHNPPSQNNITRDVAVLSQLTNKIRLYGTDCNQTQMLIHAVQQLKMENDIKIWLGVWQDGNSTTNTRQLAQMWEILDKYGADPFEGVIVANEILFREEMTIAQLGTILDGVRANLTSRNMKLPVASSDLGDNWEAGLAAKSDYIMANIHPFFAGVSAESAASWTYSFWSGKDKQFWKSDQAKNIISETGWPSAGGKDCGSSTVCDSSTPGSVASIGNMNLFMNDWVCQALANGTNYFWFEAFDEPWKVRFNTPGKEWEDKWGLLDVNRNLKQGVKIPDCGGKTV